MSLSDCFGSLLALVMLLLLLTCVVKSADLLYGTIEDAITTEEVRGFTPLPSYSVEGEAL